MEVVILDVRCRILCRLLVVFGVIIPGKSVNKVDSVSSIFGDINGFVLHWELTNALKLGELILAFCLSC